METLDLDFNRLDQEGRVRIGPEARKRLRPILATLAVGDRVLVVDGEGSSCEGVLWQPDSWVVHDHHESSEAQRPLLVTLDMATWKDVPV